MLLALARGLFAVAALSSFGTSLFAMLVLPIVARGLDAKLGTLIVRRLRSIQCVSLGAALLAALVWLVLETAAMADTRSLAETVATIPSVLLGTRFGQVLALQVLALAGAAAATACGGRGVAAIFAGLAALLEAGHSHAFAMTHGVSVLLVSQALHLLAAGGWLGGLLPLMIVVRESPLGIASLAARRFSTLALVAVVFLAVTAFFQGIVLSGGLKGLTGTAYGAVLLIKTLLFAALIALAAINRLRMTPALAGPRGETSRRLLGVSIGLETALGLCAVLAASVLSSLEPGMHLVGA
jgi:putative copper resistance protein D